MSEKELLVWLNNKFTPLSQACLNVRDHGILYGDGIFEGIRAYEGRVFELIKHIDRLFDSAKMINLNIGYSKQQMIDFVIETLRKNQLNTAYIRLVVTRGTGDLSLSPESCKKPNIFIIAKPIPPMANPEGITAITSTIRRIPHSVFSPNIKSLNYLNNVLAHMDAKMKGADEAVMLDIDGNVAECTGENIFMIKNNILITPPHINSLKGITRETILYLSHELSIVESIEIRHMSLFELYAADEIFVTGTASEVAPITKLDGRLIGNGNPGKLTVKLQNAFKQRALRSGYPIYKLPAYTLNPLQRQQLKSEITIVPLREVPRDYAKLEIAEYIMQAGCRKVYISEIAEKLRLDINLIMEILEEFDVSDEELKSPSPL